MLSADIVGYTTRAFEHELDRRWSMAYAAALDDMHPAYIDDTDGRELAVHPLFPVCLEWPALVESLAANGVDMRRTVHATHDLHLLRPLAPPALLTTRATIIGIEQRQPGIYLGWRFDTVDERGDPVARTWQGNLFLGETLDGPARWLEPMPERDAAAGGGDAAGAEIAIEVPANLAHTYTECARIWNPIHTDAAIAAAAGIGRPLLHGTASLALAVSAIVGHWLEGDPRRVRRAGGRFAAMVMLPDALQLVPTARSTRAIEFELLNAAGGRAVRGGFVELG